MVIARHAHHSDEVRFMFDITATLYDAYWGEFFHLAAFDPGENGRDFDTALRRMHECYFEAIRGAEAGRILDLGCGGGAFAAWMAELTPGEVVGIDISTVQLHRAHARTGSDTRDNLHFLQHDIMRVGELPGAPFDAAVCLDAACYLPAKGKALHEIATRLSPGARLLLVDWCSGECVSPLQEELILQPLREHWRIPTLDAALRYPQLFAAAGFRLLDVMDLSERVRPSWERAYEAAHAALTAPPTSLQIVQIAANAVRHGHDAVTLLKEQFTAAVVAKSAVDAEVLRYVAFLAQRA